MQARDKYTPDQTLEKQPGSRFRELIKEVISETNKQTIKQGLFSDGLEPIRACRDDLVKAYSTLEPKMRAEENKREDFKVSSTLYHSIKSNKAAITTLKEKRDKLPETYELKKAEYNRLKNAISESDNKKVGDIIVSGTKDIVKENNDLNKLESKKNDLLQKRIAIETKIQGKCCSCFPSCIKQELKEQNDNEAAIKEVETQVTVLLDQKSKLILNNTTKIDDTKSKYDEIDQLLSKLAKDYLDEKEKIENDLQLVETKLATDTSILHTKKKTYFSMTSNEIMLNCIRVYACYIRLKESIDTVWATKFANNKGETSKNDNLNSLNEKLDLFRNELDTLMASLWCPHSADRDGKTIYKQFLALTPQEQELFLKIKNDDLIIKKIIPTQEGSRLTSLLSDVSQFSFGTLFTSDQKEPQTILVSPVKPNNSPKPATAQP